MPTTKNIAVHDTIHVAPLEVVKDHYRSELEVEPKAWLCPGNHNPPAWVVYARAPDGRCYFICTRVFGTTDEGPPTIIIDNVEDIETFLRSSLLDPRDMYNYKQYFRSGLKEALMAA